MSANPLSLSWLIVFLKQFFRFRRVEIGLSHLEDEIGIVANTCRTAKLFTKHSLSINFKALLSLSGISSSFAFFSFHNLCHKINSASQPAMFSMS